MLRLQTLVNTSFTMNCAPSKSRPTVDSCTNKISVWFADDQPLCFQIKHLMKTSAQASPIYPALFQIAARIEVPRLPKVSKPPPATEQTVPVTSGPDIQQDSSAEMAKNETQRRVYLQKIAGMQVDA
jgi:hypothetical protein